jgi:hypothetical protein
MSDLSVDLDGIDGFADSLDRLRAAFDSSAVDDITSFADSVAGPGLAEALREFGQRWVSGREVLTSYFQALTTMARTSSAKLRAADVDLARKAG